MARVAGDAREGEASGRPAPGFIAGTAAQIAASLAPRAQISALQREQAAEETGFAGGFNFIR